MGSRVSRAATALLFVVSGCAPTPFVSKPAPPFDRTARTSETAPTLAAASFDLAYSATEPDSSRSMALRDETGRALFRVALQPISAAEGGVVAFELVVTRAEDESKKPENLLGERHAWSEACHCHPESAFDLSVENVMDGNIQSEFGAVRSLTLPDEAGTLLWTIGELEVDQGFFRSIRTHVEAKR